ncbi:MAG: hypothetical protein JEZ11_22000 [Desulfobacterales bacterium]|nr:hypothetical protein [Desulfobacterales bacterium]
MKPEIKKTMKIKSEDLPILIEVEGSEGERRWYEMLPAGRKFGILLNSTMAEGTA